nr:GATA zinc finger domain-containing protein 1 isoform X1 [Oryctolagus cuniculus]
MAGLLKPKSLRPAPPSDSKLNCREPHFLRGSTSGQGLWLPARRPAPGRKPLGAAARLPSLAKPRRFPGPGAACGAGGTRVQRGAARARALRGQPGILALAWSGGPTSGRPGPAAAIPVSLRPRGPPEPAAMPLGLKPTCSVCKTTSSSMWKKGPQGEILCHHCTGRGGTSGGGAGAGPAGATGGGGGGGFGATTFASTSAAPPQSNGGGGGKQSKQEIHRRSARLRNTKYKSAPAAEKKVSTKGKGRRHIFKLKNPIKAPESVSTIITAESIFYKGVYYQIGDVVSVIDEQDGKPYYAQIRGFIQDQYCEKSAALTWLIPTLSSPRDRFDPASYIIGPEEDLPRKMEYLEFVCHAPSEYFKSRSSPFPTVPTRPEKGYIWTHVGPTPAITIKETVANHL